MVYLLIDTAITRRFARTGVTIQVKVAVMVKLRLRFRFRFRFRLRFRLRLRLRGTVSSVFDTLNLPFIMATIP